MSDFVKIKAEPMRALIPFVQDEWVGERIRKVLENWYWSPFQAIVRQHAYTTLGELHIGMDNDSDLWNVIFNAQQYTAEVERALIATANAYK